MKIPTIKPNLIEIWANSQVDHVFVMEMANSPPL